MIRPRQVRLKLNQSQFKHCQQLSQESAKVWNAAKNFFWRTYRKKGIWLKESSMKRYIAGRFGLHSQSVQAIVEKFYDNLKTARTLRRSRAIAVDGNNPDIRYPYKNKNWFCVHWKKGAIKVDGRAIQLSNGKGRQCMVFKLPVELADCQPKTVELIWQNGYWLSITLEVEGKQQVLGFNTAAIDMLASLTDAWRFAGLTELPVKFTQSPSLTERKLKSFPVENFAQLNGKGTNVSLKFHGCNHAVRKIHAGGNVCNPSSPK